MMGLAILDYHWTADQFWAATPHEFFAAQEIVVTRNKAMKAAQRG